MVMWKLADAAFPAASVAVHATALVPMGKTDPTAGTQETVGLGSATSEALTTKST